MTGSRIYEGDLVLVRKQPEVENGEIAVVRTNESEATLKRVKYVDGTYVLYPDNPKYSPVIIKSDNAQIIGKVIKVEFDPNARR
jgi:repressor LexA